MKTWEQVIALLFGGVIFASGCGKQSKPVDQKWSLPVTIGSSIAGLGGSPRLYKLRDTLIGVQVQHGGAAQLFFLNLAKGSWSTTQSPRVPDGDWLHRWGAAVIDTRGGRVVLPGGYAENDQLVMKLSQGKIDHDGSLVDVTEREWTTGKTTLIGPTGTNVKLNQPGLRYGTDLGTGLASDLEAYIPFSQTALTYFGINNVSNGPYATGVFYSPDFGKTWQLEKVSDQYGGAPALCKTTGHVYFVAGVYPLWASRRMGLSQWEKPNPVATTLAMVNGMFDVAGDGDTAHVCWMDRRHNKMRFNLTGRPIENNDIYYRRRKDSDREWSKEVHLSKGLLYCYAPTIAAEGSNVVVAWAGIKTADKQHTDMGPNDIYYVTSNDSGKTWTAPLGVTAGAKDGITAGMPQVALLNGTIHLLYIQGARKPASELSPGLTKLGLEAWPIYYTQRPFPN